MSELKVDGAELKKMIKFSREGAIGFAFNPGKSDADHFLAMHRKRPGDFLAKTAKKEGVGAKVAYGSCQTVGKNLELTCEKQVPNIAKVLKKYLKSEGVNLNVKVLDASGKVIEADGDEDEDAATPASAPAGKGGDDAAAVVARVKKAQAQLAGVPAPVAKKLVPALKAVAEALKAKDVDGASASLAKIEAVLAKVGEAAPAAPDPAGAPSAVPDNGGEQNALVARVKGASARLGDVPDAAAKKLQEALKAAVALIKAGDLAKAGAALDKIEEAIGKVAAKAAAPAAESGGAQGAAEADQAEDDEDVGGDPMAIWRKAKEGTDKGITALQAALKSHGHPNLKKLADKGMNGITSGNQTAMMKALMEYNLSSGEARVTAAKRLKTQMDSYRSFIQSDPTVALCEKNPFGVTVSIAAPLVKALDAIEDVLPV